MTLGDSKTATGPWIQPLVASLRLSSGLGWVYDDGGVVGDSVGSAAASISTILAGMADTQDTNVAVLCNWGSNDSVVMPTEATFKANYLSIIDAVSAKWPTAKAYLTRPWRRGYDANCDTLATWIAAVVAARPGVAFVADDERVWMKGADNGATMSNDGAHYSAAGQAEKVVQARTVLGY